MDPLTLAANSTLSAVLSSLWADGVTTDIVKYAARNDEDRVTRRRRILSESLAYEVEKQASSLLQNPAVLAGLGSAAVGGGMTAMGKKRPGEKGTGRAWRVLRNAAVSGILGGGAVAALTSSGKDFSNALPAGDVDPVTQITDDPKLRAGLGLAGGSAMMRFMPNVGAAKRQSSALDDVFHGLRANPSVQAGPGAAEFSAKLQAAGLSPDKYQRMLRSTLKGRGVAETGSLMSNFGYGTPGVSGQADLLAALRRADVNYGKGIMERAMLAPRMGSAPANIAKGLAGAGLGYFAPDIARAAADYISPT